MDGNALTIYLFFQGGSAFVIILREHLPSDVVSGQAHFGNSATVPLRKVNEFNMAGRIPGKCILGVYFPLIN